MKDFRVHIVRVTARTVNIVQNACIREGIMFRNHTSVDRLSEAEIKEFFKEPLINHIVLGVKGFFRRANLIPNRWKLRIGATHEFFTKNVDNNVQIQGLTGRMTGYWRDEIQSGRITGPHRTSVKSIEEYEKTYLDPFGTNNYQTSGFKKTGGKVSDGGSSCIMLSAKHVKNLVPVALEPVPEEEVDPHLYRVYSDESMVRRVCEKLGYNYRETKIGADGFRETSLNYKKKIVSLEEAVKKVPTGYAIHNGEKKWRTCYPCYENVEDNKSLRFVVIIRPDTKMEDLEECDSWVLP